MRDTDLDRPTGRVYGRTRFKMYSFLIYSVASSTHKYFKTRRVASYYSRYSRELRRDSIINLAKIARTIIIVYFDTVPNRDMR